MRHHQTRRKGRSLKNKKRNTRRRQRGGSAASMKDWFRAIDDFEARKGDLGTNYTIASLADPTLTLPEAISAEDEGKYLIRGINVLYPPTPLPADYIAPAPVDMNLIEVAQIVTYLFAGENTSNGLINQGYNTLSTFNQYVNTIKNIPEDTSDSVSFESKKTVWFLNEIEAALHRESGGDRGFTSIYDTSKFPFYILYLAANPIKLSETPLLEEIDQSMLPTQQAPVEPTA
jgi:hypothetical protein